MNRADPTLLEYMKYHIDNVDASKGPTYEKVKKFGQILLDNCEWDVHRHESQDRVL
jgi:fatty acid synthase subunit alpha